MMRRLSYVVDLSCILFFVAIGRRAHEHGITAKGMVSTAWPFLVGLAIGWYAIKLIHRDLQEVKSGYLVGTLTVIFGMLLRVIGGQGTAFPFIVVSLIFLNSTLVSWRALASRMLKRA